MVMLNIVTVKHVSLGYLKTTVCNQLHCSKVLWPSGIYFQVPSSNVNVSPIKKHGTACLLKLEPAAKYFVNSRNINYMGVTKN